MTTDAEQRALTTLSAGDTMRGLQTVRSVLAPDLNDEELKLFAMVANRSGLDPFAKQIYAIKRKGRVTFQTSIDGYRSIAARTGLYDGQDEPEYGPWIEKPVGHPEWATVRVHRKGTGHPVAATAFWDEYVPDAGPSGNGDVMWRRMPRVMLAKVAEALALRKAFPYDPERRDGIGADIYTSDEMAQAERQPASTSTPAPTAAARVAQRRAAVQGAPAATTESPQPHESTDGLALSVADREPFEAAWTDVDVEDEPATGLSAAAFKGLREQHDVPGSLVAEVARELFPGAKGLNDLADADRAALWLAIEARQGAA